MAATIRVALSIQKALFDQAEALAQQLKISRSQLFGMALENFIQTRPSQASPGQEAQAATPTDRGQRGIHQGDVYWVPLEGPSGSEPDYTHPHVVVQPNVFNRSRINTVVVCALTSNMKRAKSPGNVLLDAGEANLTRQSVVVVSQLATVDKTQLGEYIGSLSQERIDQILAGMQFLESFTEPRG